MLQGRPVALAVRSAGVVWWGMRSIRWARLRHPRLALLVVLLTLSVAVTGVIAYQAYAAAHWHKSSAEQALRNYATIAAADYGLKAKEELYWVLTEAFWPVEMKRLDGANLPPPSIIAAGTSKAARCETPAEDSARYYFRLDLRDGSLVTSGAATAPELRQWIADTVTKHVRKVYGKNWVYAMLFGEEGGRHRTLAFATVRLDPDSAPIAVYGFESCLTVEGYPIFRKMASAPLLPPEVMGKIANDSLFAVTVTDTAGRVLYRSSLWYPDTYSGVSVLDPHYGSPIIRVAVSPKAASALIAGGLPRNRVPLLIGLVVLVTSFIGVALLQLRREYELSRLRTDFVSSVSHELRTPLAQIRMFAETLLLGRVRSPEESRRSLEIIDQEARRLTHLVGNVLEFSRAERRLSQVALTPSDLAAEIRETLECFAPIAEARRVEIIASLQEGIIVPIDRGALRQVVLNLLDNAVKYGPPGQTVSVGTSLLHDRAQLWVADEGPGIVPAERERIWEPFYRLERERNAAVAGSGIGLSVVRDLVSLHGGRAWLDERATQGARFIVDLPDARVHAGPETVEAHDATSGNGVGAHGPAEPATPRGPAA
jgi:signal transduction histidine kinase